MAEANFEERDLKINLLDGHEAAYRFIMDRLDLEEKTFNPVVYNTKCQTIPTVWEIELKYHQVPAENNSYTISVKLKRKDSSYHRAKATLYVTFYDVEGNLTLPPISENRGRMVHGDELEGVVSNILPLKLSELLAARVYVLIEYCHKGIDFRRAKYDTDKNGQAKL